MRVRSVRPRRALAAVTMALDAGVASAPASTPSAGGASRAGSVKKGKAKRAKEPADGDGSPKGGDSPLPVARPQSPRARSPEALRAEAGPPAGVAGGAGLDALSEDDRDSEGPGRGV